MKMTWGKFMKWATANGWLTFANGWPKEASTVVLSADVAKPNNIPVVYFWVGWDSEKDGYIRRVRIFKSFRQAAKFARLMAKKMGASFRSRLH